MHWSKQPLCVIDFEGSTRSGVLEWGYVCLESGKLTEAATGLCQPTGTIDANDRRLHQLSEGLLANYEPFDITLHQWRRLRQTHVLCAHCAGVEARLLKHYWAYPGLPDAPFGGSPIAWGPWIDTCVLYKQIYPQLGSHKLGDLIARFGLEQKLSELVEQHCPPKRRRAHCALFDALSSALLLLHLGEEAGFENLQLQWLLDHSTAGSETPGQQDLFT